MIYKGFAILYKDKTKTEHKIHSMWSEGLIKLYDDKMIYTPYEFYFKDKESEKKRLKFIKKTDELTYHSIRLRNLLWQNHFFVGERSRIDRANREYFKKIKEHTI
jgi:hypothetical protein